MLTLSVYAFGWLDKYEMAIIALLIAAAIGGIYVAGKRET